MKHVLRTIFERKKRFAARGLFETLKDEALPVRARLTFVPAMAHFIMSFSDLNRSVLRFAEPRDELEHAVNQHTREDEQHWRWYIEDLEALGYGRSRSATSMLKELWSPDTRAIRDLTYTLVALVAGTDAVTRLALIEVMEETGNVMFSALAPLARVIEREEGLSLPFCGDLHLAHETGHAIGSDHALLASIELDPASRREVLRVVERAFDAFDAFADELSRFNHAPPAEARPAGSRASGHAA